MIDKKILTSIFAALGASLCCITPVLAVLAGSTGMASSFSWMEPFRPYLIALTISILVFAWWDKLKPVNQDIECACDADKDGKVSFWYTKTFLALVTIFSVVMLSFPYWGDTFIKSDKPDYIIEKSKLERTVINIEGMTCKACEATIEKVTKDVQGVGKAQVSHKNQNAIIEYDKTETNINEILKAIGTTGYKPISFELNGKVHKASGITIIEHKENNLSSVKCGANKCGAGKCGSGKCGSKKAKVIKE